MNLLNKNLRRKAHLTVNYTDTQSFYKHYLSFEVFKTSGTVIKF